MTGARKARGRCKTFMEAGTGQGARQKHQLNVFTVHVHMLTPWWEIGARGLWLHAESWPRETNDRRLLERFDCADDVIVPLRWAPDYRRKSGLEYVRAKVVDASPSHASQRQQVKRASNLKRCFAMINVGQLQAPIVCV